MVASVLVTILGKPDVMWKSPGYKPGNYHHLFQWGKVSISLDQEALQELAKYHEAVTVPSGDLAAKALELGKRAVRKTLEEDPDMAYDRARDDRAEKEALDAESEAQQAAEAEARWQDEQDKERGYFP